MEANSPSSPRKRPMLAVLFPLFLGLGWLGSLLLLRFQGTWIYGMIATAVILALAVSWRTKGWAPKVLVLLALAIPAWKFGARFVREAPLSEDEKIISELVSTEERILDLTPGLRALSDGLLNLQFPDAARQELFESRVQVKDLAYLGGKAAPDPETKTLRLTGQPMWTRILEKVSWFEHTKFYFIDGKFIGEGYTSFEGKVGFSGLARMKSGQWRGMSGKQTVTWRKSGEAWKIAGWLTEDWKERDSPQLLFEETLSTALPRGPDYEKARRSVHQEEAIKHYRSQKKHLPHPYFAPISANQKPGIAVVDIEGDGDDDIYVTVRMGENLLLENQGDGTFLETAKERGINFTGHGTCALFADFDNDGDQDLLLGRSLRPSLYFQNIGGIFTATEQETPLPMLAVSMSAADFNSDGLLDFYLLTYRPATIKDSSSPSGGSAGQLTKWPDQFFEPKAAAEYYKQYEAANKGADPDFPDLLNQIGPRNVLYVNRGSGVFEVAPENEQLGIWRNSLQATWSDFDEDGDPDVYIANDWAPDNLFRNDGPGKGFTDITREAGTAAFGFAMGASWGDYDQDGAQDLYVTNMYSKAGMRITKRVAEINKTYVESAAGNYLYRQKEGGKFELVSGFDPPSLTVANGGWGWGGQFADFDNDSYLDIYALSGYFTAPEELASEVDL